jgi:peptide/nickel transport system permease protein
VLRYIVRRLIGLVVLLLILSVITFGLFYMLPASPAAMSCGQKCRPEQIKRIERRWGLDKPIYVQYAQMMRGIVAGRDVGTDAASRHCAAPCLGYSFQLDEPVTTLMVQRAPATFWLVMIGAVIWVVGGVSVGLLSALRRGSLWDRTAMAVALAGRSMPGFFIGLAAIFVCCAKFRLLPWPHYVYFGENPGRWLQNMILPCLVLGFVHSATYARFTRASMLDSLAEDYVRTARAKGLPERVVVLKHAFRAGMVPLVTIFGLEMGGLLGGVILIEQVFGIPGLGMLTLNATVNADLPLLFGLTLATATLTILANLAVDLAYTWLDPRVRLD